MYPRVPVPDEKTEAQGHLAADLGSQSERSQGEPPGLAASKSSSLFTAASPRAREEAGRVGAKGPPSSLDD